MLLMKCTKRIDDMGAPCITPWIQDSIIHPQAFGLIYHVSPYGFLDPRSSFCIYLPICMNCLKFQLFMQPRIPVHPSLFTPLKHTEIPQHPEELGQYHVFIQLSHDLDVQNFIKHPYRELTRQVIKIVWTLIHDSHTIQNNLHSQRGHLYLTVITLNLHSLCSCRD